MDWLTPASRYIRHDVNWVSFTFGFCFAYSQLRYIYSCYKSRMKVVIVLFLLCALAYGDAQKIEQWGNVTNFQLCHDTIEVKGRWLRVVNATITCNVRLMQTSQFPNKNWLNWFYFWYFQSTWNSTIAGIRFIDRKTKSEVTNHLIQGGVGMKSASIRIDSARGSGIRTEYFFYGSAR